MHQLRRGDGFSYFNTISSDKNGVYYKEEIGKTVYTIKSDFTLDSLCYLDFSKYAFREDDYTFEKLQQKTDQYRLYNILPSDDYMIFILQKGLMAEKLVSVFWDKEANTICQFDVKVEYQGREFSVFPLVIDENKVIAKLVDTNEELDSDNPVFVVLKIHS